MKYRCEGSVGLSPTSITKFEEIISFFICYAIDNLINQLLFDKVNNNNTLKCYKS